MNNFEYFKNANRALKSVVWKNISPHNEQKTDQCQDLGWDFVPKLKMQ